MQIHTLPSQRNKSKPRRVGRGGKRGSYSGRGIKGQKARSGRRIRPEVRDLIKKIPKRRGYGRGRTFPPKMRVAVKAVLIAKKFKPGEIVTPKSLAERGLIKLFGGKVPEVKILEPSNFLKALTVRDCKIARSHG